MIQPRPRFQPCGLAARALAALALAFTCTFAQAFVITISPPPVGGRVTSDVGGINCPGTCASSDLAIFTTIVLTATADAGNILLDWKESGGSVNFTPTYSFTVLNPRTLTVTFGGTPTLPGPNSVAFPILVPVSYKIPSTGLPPPTISLEAGTLPSGLSLAADGTFSGTPAFGTLGSYPLTIRATNLNGITAPTAFTVTIQKRNQVITFGTPPPATVQLSAASINLQGQSTSGGDVTYATTTPSVCTPWFGGVILVAGGTCEVQADQAGDATWNAAPQVVLSIAVQSSPAVSSSNISTFPVGQSTQFQLVATGFPAPTISVTGTLPPGVVFDSAASQLTGAALAGTTGTYNVQVTASNGVGANGVQALELNVTKGAQTITPPLEVRRGHLPGDAPFDIDAFASSFLPPAFSSSTPAICAVSGARVTLTGAQGLCTITATQAGDANYLAATPATWSVIVNSARIDTFAGGGILDGAAAIDAKLNQPAAIVQLPNGSVLIADQNNHRVRIVTGGTISTFAGTGVRGFSGDGGPASTAKLDSPSGLGVDVAGNAYIADAGNNRIRKVAVDGTITTIAGSGMRAVSGDGGPATAAGLSQPRGLAVDPAGNLHFIDAGRLIRKFTPGGTISTIAGNRVVGYHGDGGLALAAAFNEAHSLAFDGAGLLYVSDFSNNRVRRISAISGTITTFAGTGVLAHDADGNAAAATAFAGPAGIAIDSSGHLLIGEVYVPVVRKVNGSGIVSTVAGGGPPGPSEGVAATAARVRPAALAASTGGAFYIADQTVNQVRLVTGAGTIFTFANLAQATIGGDGGPARSALLYAPAGIARDAAGNVYFSDSFNNRVRKVSPAGVVTTLAGSGTPGFSGDSGPATAAQLFTPDGVAVDAAGNVFIADRGNSRVRKVTPQGIISTYAGNGTFGSSGDGGPATAASLGQPTGLAIAPDGALHISDSNEAKVRRVSPQGIISTVAGNGNPTASGDGGPATSAGLAPQHIAFDRAGNLLIADYGNSSVRKVSTAGTITTIAGTGAFGYSGDGGQATSATLRTPTSVAADPFGNVYVGDANNHVIRRIDGATGVITSLTNATEYPFSGEAEPASIATLGRLEGLMVDPLGNLYIADTPRNLIRKVTFDSQPAAFAFATQTGVAPGSVRQSEAITPTAFDATAVVTVSGGEFSIGCTGTFISAQGAISPGQSVCVRHTASATAGDTVTTTLSIGGILGSFSSTAAAAAPANPARLANISTRMQVLTGNDVLIGGFIIGGSAPKTVVVRARGPSLIPLGVANALGNPVLQLFSGPNQIAANDNWQTDANAATLQASGYQPSNALEAALYMTLGPGAYTAIVTGAGGTTGVGIIEVFEVDHPEIPLINIATRGQVLTGGDVMIGGFIIQGDAPQTVVVRARGPSLTSQGVPGALANPVLQLYSGQTVIAANDDWGTAANAATLLSSGFAPANALESAILITLPPGAYTAIVTGAGGGTGVGIIEVFAQ